MCKTILLFVTIKKLLLLKNTPIDIDVCTFVVVSIQQNSIWLKFTFKLRICKKVNKSASGNPLILVYYIQYFFHNKWYVHFKHYWCVWTHFGNTNCTLNSVSIIWRNKILKKSLFYMFIIDNFSDYPFFLELTMQSKFFFIDNLEFQKKNHISSLDFKL